MRLEALEVFISIVDTASLSAASRREHLTQSTVSATLAALEREVGCTLIERSQGQRSTLSPTQEGTIFYHFAQEVVRLRRRLDMELSGVLSANSADRKLTIVTGPTISANVLPVLISEFRREYPDISVQVQTYASDVTRHKIRDDEYEVAVTTTRPEEPSLICERFFYDPVVLICNNELKVEDTITLAQLKKLPIVIREEASAIMQNLTKNLAKHDIALQDLNISLQVFGNFAVKEAIQNGPLCGFTSLSTALGIERERRYRIVNIADYHQNRYIYLVRRRTTPPKPAVQASWRFALGTSWRGAFPFDTRCGM